MLWNDDITTIKGIGDKIASYYRRIGINSVGDLVMHIPRGYDEYGEIIPVCNIREHDTVIVAGSLLGRPTMRKVRNMTIVSARLSDGQGAVTLVWFNMPFIAKNLRMGTYYIIRGKVSRKNNQMEIIQPKILTKEEYYNKKHKLMPLYHLTDGLTNNAVSKATAYALTQVRGRRDYLKQSIIKDNGLMNYMQAIKAIHYPKNRSEMLEAKRRLVFDEFFAFLLLLRGLRGLRQKSVVNRDYSSTDYTDKIISELPYELTGAQKNVWQEIKSDMKSGYAMNRLVQGDVGSGKTIVAALALCLNASNGYQGVLMAPTEVLARQHYEDLSELLSKYGLKTTLLIGHMTAKEKRLAYETIKNHETDVIIGTHALIQDAVEFDNLGLVITDEQHRFGVKQRDDITKKGDNLHVIVMSATPIPRTLSLIVYGDMDVSIIDEVPKVRVPIANCVVGQSYRNAAYKHIISEVEKGNRAYIVCPMIEESETTDLENVTEYYLRLSEIMPGNINIDILHGKMNAKEKAKVMDKFASGETQILISTTVIEVGINVPEATVMMIENAERFGLAQLHQLRGRVGRSDRQSYCIFMTANESKETMERLNILNRSNDGFYIANEDLRLRGPGDMFGVRQSGETLFTLADIYNDADVLKLAHNIVDSLPESEVEEVIKELVDEKNKFCTLLSDSYMGSL